MRTIAAGFPFLILVGVSLLAPANPTSGALPGGFLAAFRWTVIFGQGLLWIILASVHAWYSTSKDDTAVEEPDPSVPASDVSRPLDT